MRKHSDTLRCLDYSGILLWGLSGHIISKFIIKCHCEHWGWHTSTERNLYWPHFILLNMELCFQVGEEQFPPPACLVIQVLCDLAASDITSFISHSVFTSCGTSSQNSQTAQLELINWRRMHITSYRHFCCLGLSVFHYLCISTSTLTAEKPSK